MGKVKIIDKIRSEVAYVYATFLVIAVGFIKVGIKAYPHEVTIGAIVTLTVALFSKRLIQKHKRFNNDREVHED